MLRNGTRVPKLVSQMRNTLRNGALAAIFYFLFFWISQPFSSWEMRFTVLRNGTRVPKVGFVTAKYPTKWSFGYEIGIFHVLGFCSCFAAAKWGSLCCEMALICQKWFRNCENFRREGPKAANWFRSKVPISQTLRNLANPCFCPIFAPKDFLLISLHFLLPEIIQKPILHQNKLELKHWNQN